MYKTRVYSAVLIFLTALSFLAFSSPIYAQTVNSSTTINVNIQAVSEITLFPSALLWSNVQPGHTGGTKLLDIVNTGSLNVTDLYSFISTTADESVRPYGTGNSSLYSAGSVIVMKNNSYSKYFFTGRLEWNETKSISNMILSGVNSPASYGFYRNTSYEYNWLVGNGTNGLCNNTGTQFALSDYVDNGTASTRTPTTSQISLDGSDAYYSYFSVGRSTSPLYESCVATSSDCSKIYIYRYDKRSVPNFGSCGNSYYIQVPDLATGSDHTLTLDAYVPLGIPNGDLNTTTFTVVAT